MTLLIVYEGLMSYSICGCLSRKPPNITSHRRNYFGYMTVSGKRNSEPMDRCERPPRKPWLIQTGRVLHHDGTSTIPGRMGYVRQCEQILNASVQTSEATGYFKVGTAAPPAPLWPVFGEIDKCDHHHSTSVDFIAIAPCQ
ncbi:hypothetical protein Y032_0024g937 [Ancylostoma ceylanicum]|uniref:Uncharacterized protein n=1 Tax=Ancylostoma ceylanicum TaxID=53326 RepID=A0A016UX56_9BILA|nr:hypothetical protein Y032_0024g937 [Ancylostoma ceylanicum]